MENIELTTLLQIATDKENVALFHRIESDCSMVKSSKSLTRLLDSKMVKHLDSLTSKKATLLQNMMFYLVRFLQNTTKKGLQHTPICSKLLINGEAITSPLNKPLNYFLNWRI